MVALNTLAFNKALNLNFCSQVHPWYKIQLSRKLVNYFIKYSVCCIESKVSMLSL